jgi:hypothetical protein
MNCMVNPGSFTGAIAEVSVGRPDYLLTAVIGDDDGLCRQQQLIAVRVVSRSRRDGINMLSTYCTY